MKEYVFDELGFFAESDCKAIKEEMDGSTYMNFSVNYSNIGGNCTLIISTSYDATPEEMRDLFTACLFCKIRELKGRR